VSAIVLRREEQADLLIFAKAIVSSDLFTQQGIRTVEQAAVAMVAGREIGLGPIEAIRSFHFANGGVQPSADLLARLIRRSSRYDYRVVELTDEACELEFVDHQLFVTPSTFCSRFTMDDAKRAGLGKRGPSGAPSSWEKYPRNMLFSRAMTNGVAWFAPDVIDALRSLPGTQGVDDLTLEGLEPESTEDAAAPAAPSLYAEKALPLEDPPPSANMRAGEEALPVAGASEASTEPGPGSLPQPLPADPGPAPSGSLSLEEFEATFTAGLEEQDA